MLKAQLKYLPILTAVTCGALALIACGKTNTDNTVSKDPNRNGAELVSISRQYEDSQPVISDDGSKVVFISWRDSSATAAVAKAYKSDWSAGAAPGALARVTSSDIGSEELARISSDGSWVALRTVTKNQTDLYLQDYVDNTKAPVQITNDAKIESDLAFSPDGKLLAWLTRDLGSNQGAATVVAVGDGSASALAQQVKVADGVKQVFWLPSATGYILVTAQDTGTASPGMTTYTQHAFATAAAAASASASVWVDKFSAKAKLAPVASQSQAIFFYKDVPADGRFFAQTGDGHNPTIEQAVLSEAKVSPTTAGATPQPYTTPFGYDILGAAFSADGNTAFYLARQAYLCGGDQINGNNFGSYGSIFLMGGLDPAGVPTAFSVRSTAAMYASGTPYVEGWEIAGDICDRQQYADKRHSRTTDTTIQQMAVNGAATSTKYRMAYVSRFTPHFNANCDLLTGDPEVMLLDVDGDTKKVYPLSNNKAPIADSSANACSL